MICQTWKTVVLPTHIQDAQRGEACPRHSQAQKPGHCSQFWGPCGFLPQEGMCKGTLKKQLGIGSALRSDSNLSPTEK